jgi:hypothetical protein
MSFRAILNNKIPLNTPVGASAIAEAHRRFLISIENNLRIFCKKGNNNNS